MRHKENNKLDYLKNFYCPLEDKGIALKIEDTYIFLKYTQLNTVKKTTTINSYKNTYHCGKPVIQIVFKNELLKKWHLILITLKM
jgi:hypothetical protein